MTELSKQAAFPMRTKSQIMAELSGLSNGVMKEKLADAIVFNDRFARNLAACLGLIKNIRESKANAYRRLADAEAKIEKLKSRLAQEEALHKVDNTFFQERQRADSMYIQLLKQKAETVGDELQKVYHEKAVMKAESDTKIALLNSQVIEAERHTDRFCTQPRAIDKITSTFSFFRLRKIKKILEGR